jgi:hypothetical protein
MSVYRDLLKKVDAGNVAAETAAPVSNLPRSAQGVMQEDVARLAHRMMHLRSSRRVSSILFCGIDPGCGVSTIVRQLALELEHDLSQDKERILILDGTDPGNRLQTFVMEEASLEESVEPLGGRVDLLRGDTLDGFWLRRIGTGKLSGSMEKIKARYSWVLMDMPPATDNQNLIWSVVSDGVVLVIDSGRSRIPNVNAVIEHFQSFSVPLLGSIVNRKRMEIPEFLYKMWFSGRRV